MTKTVELQAPDITPYKAGNTGVPYATTFDSGRSGPHVMVNALVHGNELCGAIALDLLFRKNVRPKQGKLTLSFANVAAYERFDPAKPEASRFVDEDFNRVWSDDVLKGERNTIELRRAREMRPLMDTVDVLLDIHSMQKLAAPLALAGPLPKNRALSAEMGAPVYVVSDFGHQAGKRLRDYGGFGEAASHKRAALVECGQHWLKPTADVAIDCALRFLLSQNVIDREFAASHLLSWDPQRFVEVTHAVTIEHEPFEFVGSYHGLEVVEKAGTLIARDGAVEVRTPYDRCVMVMPSQRLSRGLTAVRLGRFTG